MTDPEVPPEEAAPDQGSVPPEETPEPSVEPSVEDQLAERTADLQRLQAEYVNYKRRVDRDRILVSKQGEAAVLRDLLTVLDDLGRAEAHGELVGGFKAVADALQGVVKQHGLEAFGAQGDAFDPQIHEALLNTGESAEVTEVTVDSVIRTGYRVGDDVIRHAQVAVVEPATAETEDDDAADEDTRSAADN